MKTKDLWDMTPCRLVNTSDVSEELAAYTIRVIQDERNFLRKEAANSSENLVAICQREIRHLLEKWKFFAVIKCTCTYANEPG